MFFHGTRVERDTIHVTSPCMGCTCPCFENNISVRAKMTGLSTIKRDALAILSDVFCCFLTGFFPNEASLLMGKQFLKVSIVSPEEELCK